MENFLPINAPDFHRVESNGEPVLTTEQLAKAFGITPDVIKHNFCNNRDRYVAGKHFYLVTGEALNDLRGENFHLQISPKARGLYLWTKRGCARHCKILIDGIVAYVPALIKHYDAEFDKAAKVFVDTWLANDGGNHDETTD